MPNPISITQDLVAIPSVNAMGRDLTGDIYSERRVAEYVRGFLAGYGVSSELFGADPDHPNLVAHIDAGCAETVMLEAHMDTVPHDGMTIDPFDPVIVDGKLYGRGSCDTKASLATYLYAIAEAVGSKRRLTRNVILATVHDEEYAFKGSLELGARKMPADFAIVGEPTSLDIVYAHKGYCRFFITVKGTPAHSSTPWLGVNAIYGMAGVIDAIRSYGDLLAEKPDPILGPATVNIGRIFGGEAVNIVAGQCSIEIDRRLMPGQTYEQVRDEISQLFVKLDVDVTIEDAYMEAQAVCADTNGPACLALVEAARKNGRSPLFKAAHYATDASILAASGIPSVVFGPGDVAKAHTVDEFIRVEEIEQAGAIILDLISEEVDKQ
jgi:acetylornithine deacetylase